MVTQTDYKNNLIIDFDTQLTNLKRNKSFGLKFALFEKADIFLPYEITFQMILNRITDCFRPNSMIVIDSLNGLIDYFATYLYNNSNNNLKDKFTKKVSQLNSQFGSNRNAGYTGFSFLNILFQNKFVKEIPIVITSYISQRSLDKLIMELAKVEYEEIEDTNHFRRFSNTVSCLGYHKTHPTLIVTVIKKLSNSTGLTASYTDFHPCSIKISTR
ncbi:MAG TPA: hypothetical protein VLE21_01420 [Candidatus Nitrosocosmicus sp.]|nr:hypothetical protein [Candidatus Nitrosocosmicus sp.]